MYWGDLAYLVALQRYGSLGAAAKVLGVTHTTVIRRLRDLERRYGARLVEGRWTNPILTVAGSAVLDVALAVESDVLDLERQVVGQDTRLAGPLKLTTIDLLAWAYADVLAGLCKAYPGIDLEIAVDNRLHNLSRREADVALRMTNRPSEGTVGQRLQRFEYAIFAARALVASAGHRDLSRLPWVTYVASLDAKIGDAWLATNVPMARIAARVDTALIMLRAVQAGIGIAFLPASLADREAGLERLSPDLPGFSQEVWLLTPPELFGTARVRSFFAHMIGAISTPPADDVR